MRPESVVFLNCAQHRDNARTRLAILAPFQAAFPADPREGCKWKSRPPRRAPWHFPIHGYCRANRIELGKRALLRKSLGHRDCIVWRNGPRSIPQAAEYPASVLAKAAT